MLVVVPTIDVEGVHGTNPFEQMILGQIGVDGDWGVYRLAEIFRKFEVQATFFVDVYEHTFWGENRMECLCQRLVALEQDVQLHTHPSWRDDIHDFPWLRKLKKEKSFFSQQFDFMGKLSMEKQVEILEHGIDLFKKWLGCKPIAHRSGGYSINADTVKALTKVGIALDSSMFRSHPNSKINWSANRVVHKDGLVELPVTVLNYVFVVPFGFSNIKIYSKTMKTDLDTCSLEELLVYVKQAQKMGIKVLNLFMHSYSLMEFDSFYRTIKPEKTDLQKLEQFLGELRLHSDVRMISCSEFLAAYRNHPDDFDGSDAIPDVQANRKIVALAMRKYKNKIRDFLCTQGLFLPDNNFSSYFKSGDFHANR